MKFRAKRISHLYYIAQYKFKWWPFWFAVKYTGHKADGGINTSIAKFTTIDQVKSALQRKFPKKNDNYKPVFFKEIVKIDLN